MRAATWSLMRHSGPTNTLTPWSRNALARPNTSFWYMVGVLSASVAASQAFAYTSQGWVSRQRSVLRIARAVSRPSVSSQPLEPPCLASNTACPAKWMMS